ncbi:Stemmadenine O-acetyltransferase [Camellia lanceoleosa]|uniref:Stemmadenine O-acetyltransferase n=1 Tax=Camellia lanceoleosa TaxID=1840588 RepID=A0ACC0HPX1_9ERIC|nr:Stemmadenine O-acetyltransferase [Camellia lanceoleosa]
MRPRALPPFSESCMGNFLWLAVAECKDKAETELHHLAGQVNDAIAKVNGDLVKQLQGEEGSLKYFDFGWGKPTWASPVGSGESISTIFYQNMVILIETKQGDGIEAWVSMDEQQMAIFQCDRELQIYTSVDQSPLEPL